MDVANNTLGLVVGAATLGSVIGAAPATETPVTETTVPAPVVLEGVTDGLKYQVVIGNIPSELRMRLLQGAIKQFVANRATSAKGKHKKDMEPFVAYEKATAANPLQTAVAKPTTPAPALDIKTPIEKAIADLYANNIGTRTEGGTAKPTMNELDKLVTRLVQTELWDQHKASGGTDKYMTIAQKVGNGREYLLARIEEKVAAGADRKQLEAMLEAKYLAPSRMVLGLDVNKKAAALPSIL